MTILTAEQIWAEVDRRWDAQEGTIYPYNHISDVWMEVLGEVWRSRETLIAAIYAEPDWSCSYMTCPCLTREDRLKMLADLGKNDVDVRATLYESTDWTIEDLASFYHTETDDVTKNELLACIDMRGGLIALLE